MTEVTGNVSSITTSESMQSNGESIENSSTGIVDRVARVVEDARALQDTVAAFNLRIQHKEQILRQRAVTLEFDIKRLCLSITSAIEKYEIDNRKVEKLEDELYRAECIIREGDAASLLPIKDHGPFLRCLLGPINVHASRNDIRLKVKEEMYVGISSSTGNSPQINLVYSWSFTSSPFRRPLYSQLVNPNTFAHSGRSSFYQED